MTYKERAWQAHLQKWRASGMTRYAFCAHHQLKVSTLDYWQRRPRDVAQEKPAHAVGKARLIPMENWGQVLILDSYLARHLRAPRQYEVGAVEYK